ncbi:hypothetical protein [Nitrosopumilus sp. S4]
MAETSNQITELLNEINTELESQISLVKSTDGKPDSRKLVHQSNSLNDILKTSEIIQENKSMLKKFALTLQEGSTIKSLRYKKQDLERIFCNLNGI